MIGWLRGEVEDPWQQASRCGLLLICQGVGYEVQISQRQWVALPPRGSLLTLHVHQSIREDGWTLFGFASRAERDLFRELVAVSGVGPQMGMALLGAMAMEELVNAIVDGDGRRLSQAPGVGKRTAERLCLELRQKLPGRFSLVVPEGPPLGAGLAGAGAGTGAAGAGAAGMARGEGTAGEPAGGADLDGEEIHNTLQAMGYEPREIHAALRAVAAQGLEASAGTERWLGDCLRWLARSVA
ncbi:MAG: Holliday junction branch migration protein RuvA [Cyanobacteria bacterium K_Offshore_surface_m2_239]|nr:Holliday junction branch migration protein RuvA [Cyanobacteria bacterium K_Offshore_surface_m2_239]